MTRPKPLHEELPEVWKDFIRDDLIHPDQSEARNAQVWSPCFEAYLKYNAGVEIVLGTISGYPTYFVVFAQRARIKNKRRFKREVIAITGGTSGHDGPTHDADGRMVLVGGPHLVKDAEFVIRDVAGASVIRLMTFQSSDTTRWHSTIKDRFREFAELRLCPTKGEGEVVAPLDRPGGDRPNQVIEQRTQVVNEIRPNESQDRIYRLMAGDLEDIAAVLQIRPTLRGTRIANPELLDLNLKVIEVRFRSLKSPFKVLKVG